MRSSLPALLAVILTVAVLFSLTGYQVTGETASTRLLGRIGASMVELDRWLPAHRDDLNLLARNRPDAPVVPNDLPIRVEIPPQLALDASDEQLRATITSMMGQRLRNDGASAVRGNNGGNNFGVTEPVRWSITLLGTGMHSLWQAALGISGLILIVMCLAVLMRQEPPFLPVLIGALIATVLSAAGWLAALGLASAFEGAIDREIALVLRDGAWIGIRNGLAVSLIALALLYLMNAFMRPRAQEWSHHDDDLAYEGRRDTRIQTPPY
jgi:hypothetical protein